MSNIPDVLEKRSLCRFLGDPKPFKNVMYEEICARKRHGVGAMTLSCRANPSIGDVLGCRAFLHVQRGIRRPQNFRVPLALGLRNNIIPSVRTVLAV